MLASSFHSDPASRCRQIISLFFLDDPAATIVPWMGNEGFSGAQIYRIELGFQRFALRRWPAVAPEFDRLSGLHRLLEWTANLGVSQIAVPLKSRSGSTLLQIDGHLWQLEPWMPGAADFHAQPSRSRLRESMRVLARWHTAAQTFLPRSSEHTWFASVASGSSPGLQERCQAIRHYQQDNQAIGSVLTHYPDPAIQRELAAVWKHFQVLAPDIAKQLATAALSSVSLQPCLRDVWHDHLLFTGDTLTGLIDPSACRSENVTTDLARLLGSLVADDRAEWDFALNCYQELRPLSLTELRLLSAFDVSGVLLSGMTWLDWLLVQNKAVTNRARVLERLQTIVRRLERLHKRPSLNVQAGNF